MREFLAFALAWIPYALLAWRFRFICDDAFISFRYAKNWALGYGLRFNLGDQVPVEGYSNFLWVAFSTCIEALHADITFWAPLVSFCCGSLLLYLVFRTLRRRCELQLPVAWLAVVSLGCSVPFAVWSTSGLETMPFALLLFAAFDRLVLRHRQMAPVGGGLAGLALALVRTEGLAWALLVGALAVLGRVLASQRCKKAILTWAAICGIGYLVYFALRFGYYQSPLANTVYAKVSMSPAILARGANYVVGFTLAFVTPLLLIPGAILALRSAERAMAVPVVGIALANVGYAIIVGGDTMAMGRLLVPGLVVFGTFLFGWLLQSCWGESAARRALALVFGVATIVLGLLPGWNIHVLPEATRVRFSFRSARTSFVSEYEKWVAMRDNTRFRARLADLLRKEARPGDALVAGSIGSLGYYSDLFIHDRNGIVTPSVARREVTGSLKAPGHDKKVPYTFFLGERPTFILLGSVPASSNRARAIIDAFRRKSAAAQYVPDVMPIHDQGGAYADHFLVFCRRCEDPALNREGWEHLNARFPAKLDAPASKDGQDAGRPCGQHDRRGRAAGLDGTPSRRPGG